MSDAATASETVLRLERTFDAPREEVFDAWTNPEVLKRWWAVGLDWETPLAEVDLREGGRYRLTMRTPTGESHTVGGEYSEISRPERLVYTWAWEAEEANQVGTDETLVTVEFAEEDGGTRVVLTHSGFPSADSRDRHAHGWNGCLDNLERVFAGER